MELIEEFLVLALQLHVVASQLGLLEFDLLVLLHEILVGSEVVALLVLGLLAHSVEFAPQRVRIFIRILEIL